jgi:hypothetical protein
MEDFFWALYKVCGIRDALATLLSWERIDEDMGWAHEPLIHGGSGLNGEEFLHEALIEASPKRAEGFGIDKIGLITLGLDLADASGIHDGKIGAKSVADRLIRTGEFMFEQLQSQQDSNGDTWSPASGFLRKATVKALFDGGHECLPRKSIGPKPNGMGIGDELGDLKGGAGPPQPVLKMTDQAHSRFSPGLKNEGP